MHQLFIENVEKVVEKVVASCEGDEKTGAMIVLKSMEEPLKQIAINAGLEGSVIVQNVKSKGTVGYGYNALNDEYGDMISFGIVDPTKVTRSALENAASVASMVLTTEALITEKKNHLHKAATGCLRAAWAACINKHSNKMRR